MVFFFSRVHVHIHIMDESIKKRLSLALSEQSDDAGCRHPGTVNTITEVPLFSNKR